MWRSSLFVRHSDLRSSGRLICSHAMSIDLADSVQRRGAGEGPYVAENDVLLDVKRYIFELKLRAHLESHGLR